MPKPSAKNPGNTEAPSPVAEFGQSLAELEALVVKMESGEQSLDESLRAFERGIALYRQCQSALEQADARVKLLLDPEHPESAQPFAPGEEP
jgi:exodeoxyribonuclease VII small subunit